MHGKHQKGHCLRPTINVVYVKGRTDFHPEYMVPRFPESGNKVILGTWTSKSPDIKAVRILSALGRIHKRSYANLTKI